MSIMFKFDEEDKKAIKNYKAGKYPAGVRTDRRRGQYDRKYNGIVIKKGKYFAEDGREIVFKNDIQNTIKLYNEDPLTGLKGRDRSFYGIKQKYVGISSRDVMAFLENSENSQRQKQPKNAVSRPS